MPYPGLLCPEPLPLRQATSDPNLLRRHPKTVQSQSLWGLWVLVHTRFEPSELLWLVWDLILITDHHSKYNHHEKVQGIDSARITKMSTK